MKKKKKKKARPTRVVQHGEEEKDKEKKRENERMRGGRGGAGGEESREGRRRPMAARSFFVMIVILEPDRPRASGPVGATAARFLTRLMADPTVDTATLIRRSRGRATENDVLLPQFDMHMPRPDRHRAFVRSLRGSDVATSGIVPIPRVLMVSHASDANCNFDVYVVYGTYTSRDRRELIVAQTIGLLVIIVALPNSIG